MTDKKLQSLKNKWLSLLDLSPPAWKNISVCFVDENAPDFRNKLGDCGWSMEDQVASIRIANPDLHSALSAPDDSIERTLVHELLHIVLQGHKASLGKYDPMLERALNILARVLVERQGTGKKKVAKQAEKRVSRKRNVKKRTLNQGNRTT